MPQLELGWLNAIFRLQRVCGCVFIIQHRRAALFLRFIFLLLWSTSPFLVIMKRLCARAATSLLDGDTSAWANQPPTAHSEMENSILQKSKLYILRNMLIRFLLGNYMRRSIPFLYLSVNWICFAKTQKLETTNSPFKLNQNKFYTIRYQFAKYDSIFRTIPLDYFLGKLLTCICNSFQASCFLQSWLS